MSACYGISDSNLTQDHPSLVGAVINRGEARVICSALIYALLDKAKVIDPNQIKSAFVFGSYCKPAILYIWR